MRTKNSSKGQRTQVQTTAQLEAVRCVSHIAAAIAPDYLEAAEDGDRVAGASEAIARIAHQIYQMVCAELALTDAQIAAQDRAVKP